MKPKNSRVHALLLAFPHVNKVGRARLEVIFTAMRTPHGFTDLMQGAQVEDKSLFVGEDLVTERTHHLQAAKKTTYTQRHVQFERR